ncbi:hypothetical protein [Pseudomonas sp.]|uniref:hypothetical protein n=1 Tax=Pseudomonas sp. TaxID=306 RepID=UPI0025873EAF|nr:hypothetical protein [Pseudomonas sp.]
MSKKPAIPSVRTGQTVLDQALSAVKQTLDAMTGQAKNIDRLAPLPATATLPEVIERLNEITSRMQ